MLGQHLQRFIEAEALDLLDELDDVAGVAAPETLVRLDVRVDRKRGRLFVVEWAEALVPVPGRLAQAYVLADDPDNVDRRFQLLTNSMRDGALGR